MKKCQYCNEEEATERISNPNSIEIEPAQEDWVVCKDCKKAIAAQQRLAMGELLKSISKKYGVTEELSENMIVDSKNELELINEETGKEFFSIKFERKVK